MTWALAHGQGIEDVGSFSYNLYKDIHTGFIDNDDQWVVIAQQDGTASGWYYAWSTDDGATWTASAGVVQMTGAHTSPAGEFWWDHVNELLFFTYQDSTFDVGFVALSWNPITHTFTEKASGRAEDTTREFGPFDVQWGYNAAGDPMCVGLIADNGGSFYGFTAEYSVSGDSWTLNEALRTWTGTLPDSVWATNMFHGLKRRYDDGESPDHSPNLEQAAIDGDLYWFYMHGNNIYVRTTSWDAGVGEFITGTGDRTEIVNGTTLGLSSVYLMNVEFDPVDQIWVMVFGTRDSSEGSLTYPIHVYTTDGADPTTATWSEVYDSMVDETTNEWGDNSNTKGRAFEHFLNPRTGVLSMWYLSADANNDWVRYDLTYKGVGVGSMTPTNEGWLAANSDMNSNTYLNKVWGYDPATGYQRLLLTASIYNGSIFRIHGYDMEEGYLLSDAVSFYGWGIPMGIA